MDDKSLCLWIDYKFMDPKFVIVIIPVSFSLQFYSALEAHLCSSSWTWSFFLNTLVRYRSEKKYTKYKWRFTRAKSSLTSLTIIKLNKSFCLLFYLKPNLKRYDNWMFMFTTKNYDLANLSVVWLVL